MNKAFKHAAGAVLEGTLVAALGVALIAGSALAGKGATGGGKPSGGGGGSLTLVVLGADGIANHGDTVTFAISTAEPRPFVSLDCYVAGTHVYAASAGFFADYPWSHDFILASNSWTWGAADCNARLYSTRDGTRTTTLGTLSFKVAA